MTKALQYPSYYNTYRLDKVKHFYQFDGQITDPLNGFGSAGEFYDYASPLQYLSLARTNILIVNAKNDPMLPRSCYPIDVARKMGNVFLEMPSRGGHVGFSREKRNGHNWAELRAFEFVNLTIR